jgi:hypothetical protein
MYYRSQWPIVRQWNRRHLTQPNWHVDGFPVRLHAWSSTPCPQHTVRWHQDIGLGCVPWWFIFCYYNTHCFGSLPSVQYQFTSDYAIYVMSILIISTHICNFFKQSFWILFSWRKLVCISLFPKHEPWTSQLLFLGLVTLVIYDDEKSNKSQYAVFSGLVYFVSLWPRYFREHPVIEYLQSTHFLNATDTPV